MVSMYLKQKYTRYAKKNDRHSGVNNLKRIYNMSIWTSNPKFNFHDKNQPVSVNRHWYFPKISVYPPDLSNLKFN